MRGVTEVIAGPRAVEDHRSLIRSRGEAVSGDEEVGAGTDVP